MAVDASRGATTRPATRLRDYLARSRPRALLSLPFVYGMAVPFVVLDLAISLYQAASFPLYGIACVRRRDHFVLDRARLPYLNAIEKAHCAYCSYANGLLAYAREIVARTEQYWCPIKHSRRPSGVHDRYAAFAEYGDGAGYASRAQALRRSLFEEKAAEDSRVAPPHE
jgi:hypothetical protein